jgi:hypothetical protein
VNSVPPDSPDAGSARERGWADHELQQLRRLAKLTFAEKLQWLEDAHRMVRHMQRGEGGAELVKGNTFYGHQDDSTQPSESEPKSDAG